MSIQRISIQKYYQNNRIQLLICFISTYLFGLIAHAYGLLNNIFSHDALNALYADSIENNAKISVGRFMVPLIRTVTRGELALPWLIGIISLFYLSLAVFLVIKIFNIKSRLSAVLVSALMVVNVTVTGCIASYVHEFDLDMLAILLAVFSVYLWQKKNIFSLIASVSLMIISLGIYQSNVTVAAVLMIGCMLLDLMDGAEFKRILLKGIKGVGILALATVAYYSLSKLFINMTDVSAMSRADALNVSDSLTENISYLNGFNAMIFYEIQKIINPASIMPKAVVVLAIVLLLLVGIAVALLGIQKIDKKKTLEKLLSLALITMLPVAAGCICIITKGEIHDIMTYAFWLVPVFVVALVSRMNATDIIRKISTCVSVICIAIIVWNNILVANTAYLKKDLEHDATLSVMTRVADDMNKREDYIPGKTKVYFIGSNFLPEHADEYSEVEKIIGLDYNTSIGMTGREWYYCSFEKYFVNYLGQPLIHSDKSFITNDIHDKLVKMPSFPNDGYMEMVGDILVIRMN